MTTACYKGVAIHDYNRHRLELRLLLRSRRSSSTWNSRPRSRHEHETPFHSLLPIHQFKSGPPGGSYGLSFCTLQWLVYPGADERVRRSTTLRWNADRFTLLCTFFWVDLAIGRHRSINIKQIYQSPPMLLERNIHLVESLLLYPLNPCTI